MPETMVEIFARGLVDKIMLEALDALDTNAAGGKRNFSQEDNVKRMPEAETTHIAIQAQVHDEIRVDYGQQEAVIAKMVRGLRNVHIGDSSYVLPPVLSNLERQVKRVAGTIELHSSLDHLSDPTEVHAFEGQGDVDQAMQNAAFDAPIELESSSTTQRKEKDASGEAAKVSLGLLHRMIEELESESANSKASRDVSSPAVEKIGHWEEQEEKFLRVIERADEDARDQRKEEEQFCFLADEEEENEARRTLMRQLKDDCFEEIAIEKSPPPSSPSLRSSSAPPPTRTRSVPAESDILRADEPQRDSSGAKRKRKRRNLAARVRKLFSAAFGRRKH